MSSRYAIRIFHAKVTGLFRCLLIIAALGVLQCDCAGNRNWRTINAATLVYGKWNKTVPFYIDSDILPAEAVMIRQAITAVVSGINSIVTFSEVNSTAPQFKIKFTTLAGNPKVSQTLCTTDPGVNMALLQAGLTEQPVLLARGATGCMCSYCNIMRYVTMVLGKMSEHNRGDRDTYINVTQANLANPELNVPYTANQAYWALYSYDYCSITHNQRSEFANSGLSAFSLKTLPTAPADIPWLCQLSLTDCKLVNSMYHGDPSQCQQPACASQIAAMTTAAPGCIPTSATTTTTASVSTTTSTTPTSTVTTSTTTPTTTTAVPTCSTATFCSTTPDESISLSGPYPEANYLLFSGNCLLTYTVNFGTRTLQAVNSPTLIKDYLQTLGMPAFVPPVTLAFITERFDPVNGYIDTQHLQNQNGKAVGCDTNYASSPTCSADVAAVIPTSQATSATTQYSTNDVAMNQFVIDATGTKIRLTDPTMTTIYQPKTGSINLLTGQTTITKITAIQLAQNDDTTVSPYTALFVVFGTGADGVTPYVGFVNMPASGSSTVALVPAAIRGSTGMAVHGSWYKAGTRSNGSKWIELLSVPDSNRPVQFNTLCPTGLPRGKSLRTINAAATLYAAWNKTVPYYIDPDFVGPEQDMIRLAIATVTTGMNSVVTFSEVASTSPLYKIKFSALTADPTIKQTICFSDPGVNKAAHTAGKTEQIVALARGATGCMCSYCTIMKYIALVLGKMLETDRADRDTFIKVIPANLVAATAYQYTEYTAGQANWSFFLYDYCSITHNQRSDYALPSTSAFTIVAGGPADIPQLCQLSLTDCKLLNMIYHGDSSKCTQPICTQQILAAKAIKPPACAITAITPTSATTLTSTSTTSATTSTSTTPTTPTSTTPITTTPTTTTPTSTTPTSTTPASTTPTSTTASTTTTAPTCSTTTFCSQSPDESGYVSGPFSFQTFLAFTRDCLVEYSFDFATEKLQILSGPKAITAYLQGTGGPTIVPPVTLAFASYQLDATTGNDYCQLQMQDQAASSDLACAADQDAPSIPPTCTQAATATGIIPTSKATSASSQYSAGDSDINQYVIDSTGTLISLMDGTMTTTYQPTSGTINLLTGQTVITKITAIQVASDEDDDSPLDNLLIVFGTGADGVTPYVGFVNMNLYASSAVALSPLTWFMDPLPLKSVLTGC